MDRYYESKNYLPHSESSEGLVSFLYKRIQQFMVTRKRKLVENVSNSSNGKLLDVGCGTGEFLNEMALAGWEIDGIETNAFAREIARERYNVSVHSPDQVKSYGDPKFDVITFWHVLEHLTNPIEILRTITVSLKKNGFLLIAAPNYKSFDGDYYQSFWAAYDVPRHLYHFNYETMITLLKQVGLSVSQIKRLPFDSFYISLLSEQYRKGNSFRGLWIGLRSYLQALSDSRRCSSIIFFTQKIGEPKL